MVDHTIDDDFEELSEKLFGEGNCFNSNEVRKRMYGMKTIIEAIERDGEKSIKDKNALSELDNKKIELQKERQRFYDQRREYGKQISADGRREHLYKVLEDAAKELSSTVGCLYAEQEVDPYDKLRNKTEAVLVLSDWHYGLVADNVFNRYNKEICKRRVTQVIDDAIDRLILHCCGKLHVAVLGDLWHGAIHTSARVASEELVCEQMMQASEILAQSIEKLSHYVDEVVVYVTYGNHARTVQNKNDSIHRDNMERIVPWWLEQRLKHLDNVEIEQDSGSEFLFITACGHEICAAHGDLDNIKTSPRLLSALFQKKMGKDIEYILLGDKHHRESFEELGVSAVMCGSLCGADDFANNRRLYSVPSQFLLIVDPEAGIDAEYRLKVS